MADSNPKPHSIASEEETQQQLKHLEFVQIAVIHAIVCFYRLYDCAKDNCGPLKPGVENVQGTVKVVVGPVVEKFHHLPIQLLKFLDQKVDESLDQRFHPLMRKVSTKATAAAHNTPSSSTTTTASGFAKTVYAKYEPVAEQYAVSTWRSLNQIPLFHRVAQLVLPTAAYCSNKYNEAVLNTTEKGYKLSSYLPLVPMDKIAKLFNEEAPATAPAIKPLLRQSGEEEAIHK